MHIHHIHWWQGYILSILSFVVFIIEQAQRHLWAKVIIGIAGVALILLSIWGIYMLIRGISSLKSGWFAERHKRDSRQICNCIR